MTMPNIGLGYLNPLRPMTEAEYIACEKVENNKSEMERLKPYMCPKSYGNPKACEKCPGKCSVGKQILALTSNFVKAWSEGEQPKEERTMPPDKTHVTADRETFRKACESGNAWNYLMSEFGMSKGSAKEKLVFWTDHYKDITAEFGGKTRIMVKPKTVKVVSSEPVKMQEIKPPNDNKEAVNEEPVKNRLKTAYGKGREHCRMALESGDPVAYLIAEGNSKRQAHKNIWRWKHDYADMFQQEVAEQVTEEETMEDEVSLADFLKEQVETGRAGESFRSPQDSFLATLNAKYEELKAEHEEQLEIIRKAEERSKWLESKMDALVQTLSVFKGE